MKSRILVAVVTAATVIATQLVATIPSHAGSTTSTPLDPSSPAYFARAQNLHDAAIELKTALSEDALFGGVRVDADTGEVALYLTGPTTTAVTALIAQLTALGDSITVQNAKFSERALRAAQAALHDPSLVSTLGIESVGVAPDGSGLEVTVSHDTPGLVKQLTSLAGVAVQTRVADIQTSATRLADASPWKGGARIYVASGGCTTGFGVHSNANVQYLVTAAHCGPLGSAVTNGSGTSIGKVYGNYWQSNNLDFELIKPTSLAAGNAVYNGAYDSTTGSNKTVYSFEANVAGDSVCVQGSYSGGQCGASIYATDTELYATQNGTTWFFYADEVRATSTTHALAGNGDSGGAVVRDYGTTQYIAKGLDESEVNGPGYTLPCLGVPSDSTRKCSWDIFITSMARINAAVGVFTN